MKEDGADDFLDSVSVRCAAPFEKIFVVIAFIMKLFKQLPQTDARGKRRVKDKKNIFCELAFRDVFRLTRKKKAAAGPRLFLLDESQAK